MDPVTLATLTSAVTFLATEAGKAGASEAGKTAWASIQKLLNLSNAGSDLAKDVAKALAAKPELAQKVQAHIDAAKNAWTSQSVGVHGDVRDNENAAVAGRDQTNYFRSKVD